MFCSGLSCRISRLAISRGTRLRGNCRSLPICWTLNGSF